ncbi:C40 family peptidase [Sphingobacterium suaedae]|uniref:NlpC/P60 family protein n=1 Tax=Sphingobacterium suaedae TaxID=1686402 RepID=A0ABW5KH79_9SPHI
MVTAFCHLSVVPLRAAASHRSEMVSQVLFAEEFEILIEEPDWYYIRLLDTNYEGWIQHGQFVMSTNSTAPVVTDHLSRIVDIGGANALVNGQEIRLVHGTKIPSGLLGDNRHALYSRIDSPLRTANLHDFDTELTKLVAYYKNSPYLWGGRTSYGIDCSGLSQVLYAHFGIPLPRDAYQQAELGETVDFLTEVRRGDLAFFDNEEGRIIHVGLMLDTETVLHASASVRVDKMDSEGIFNRNWNRYTHKLRIVKRYF